MAMPAERTAHAIAFLTGEVHALFLFSQVLASLHPNHALLLAHIDSAAQQGLANVEVLPVEDAVIEGYQFAIEGIRKAVKAAAGKTGPN